MKYGDKLKKVEDIEEISCSRKFHHIDKNIISIKKNGSRDKTENLNYPWLFNSLNFFNKAECETNGEGK